MLIPNEKVAAFISNDLIIVLQKWPATGKKSLFLLLTVSGASEEPLQQQMPQL